MTYETLEEAVMATLDAVRPPERLTVAEAQEKYRHLRNPGAYTGPWMNSSVPYMVEPYSVFTDLNYKARCICWGVAVVQDGAISRVASVYGDLRPFGFNAC